MFVVVIAVIFSGGSSSTPSPLMGVGVVGDGTTVSLSSKSAPIVPSVGVS